jgi:hypothetical protein
MGLLDYYYPFKFNVQKVFAPVAYLTLLAYTSAFT